MANTHALDLESGSSQYASIVDASCPNLEIAGSQTWEAWVKPESFTSSMTVMAKTNSAGTVIKRLFLSNTGAVQIVLSGLATNIACTTTDTISTGVWTHLAGVYDSVATKLQVFINGTLSKEVTASGSASDSNATFAIGAQKDLAGSELYFDGLVDECRIWNVARTQALIAANMSREIAAQTGLQGYWKNNNNYADSSGNGYNLTPSGSPVFSTDVPFVGADGGGNPMFFSGGGLALG